MTTNDNYHSTIRRPADVAKELTFFIAHFEAKGYAEKKDGKTFDSFVFSDLKPPYSIKGAILPYSLGYVSLNSRSLMSIEGTTWSMLFAFLIILVLYAYDICMSDFAESFTDRAYAWHVKLETRFSELLVAPHVTVQHQIPLS